MPQPIHTQTPEQLPLLLKLIAEGDEKAFEQLFHIHKDRVYEIAFLYTESGILAEEILQDIFVQVWQKRTELPSINHFASWIFILTRNRCFNVLRHLARAGSNQQAISQSMQEAGSDSADAKLLSSEAEKLVRQAMELLTPSQKQAFELFKLKGLSREETASQMGISPNTAKVHVLQAMRTVRAFLLDKDLLIPSVSSFLLFIF